MFLLKRSEQFSLFLNGKMVQRIEQYEKLFIKYDIYQILLFIESKGLALEPPTMINGSDATFIYKMLTKKTHILGAPAEDMANFIYMRLNNKNPIWIEDYDEQKSKHRY